MTGTTDDGAYNPKPKWCRSNIDNRTLQVQLPSLKHEHPDEHYYDRAEQQQHGAREHYGYVHENVHANVHARHVPLPRRFGHKRLSEEARESKPQCNAIYLIYSCVRS